MSVEVEGEHPAAVVAARWASWLGASVVHDTEGEDGPRLVVADGASPAGASTVVVTQPSDIGPGDATALWARSGLAELSRPDSPTGTRDRCWPRAPIPQHLSGVAATLVLGAVGLAARAGVSTHARVDQLEVLALLPMLPFASVQVPASPTGPGAGAVGGAVGGTMRAADGSVYLRLVEPDQWVRLLSVVPGSEDLARRAREDIGVLERDASEVDARLRAWVLNTPIQALLEIARSARVPIAPYRSAHQLGEDPQHRARGFAQCGREGRHLPWIVDQRRCGSRPRGDGRFAPRPDAPLRGIRILDLTWAWAGPFATTLLAELGAEVINIEWHPRPSNLRVQQPIVPGHGVDGSAWWSANQRGKRSVAIDHKSNEGRAAVADLAACCDAVIENFSPGVVDRLGIGFNDLADANDSLVYVSMSAYGATGPRSSELGYGPHLYATAGLADAIQSPGGEPSQMSFPIADPISGLVGALAVVAQLCQPDGAHLDLSELEATCAMLGDGHLTKAIGEVPPAAQLVDVLADPDLVRSGFWARDRAEAVANLNVYLARAPWSFSGVRPPEPSPAPQLGRDTRSVLQDVIGWSSRRVDAVVGAGSALEPM